MLAFKFTKSRVYEGIIFKTKEQFRREYHVDCNEKQTAQAKEVYIQFDQKLKRP